MHRKISIIMTTKDENCAKAIEAILNQNIPNSELIVVSPNNPQNSEKFIYVKDKGIGKWAALELGVQKATGDILVFTDGDVVTENICLLITPFENKNVGGTCACVLPFEDKGDKYSFFAYFLTHSAHILRLIKSRKNKFFNFTGYLYAIRKEFWQKLPKDRAEDTFIPLQIYQLNIFFGYLNYLF